MNEKEISEGNKLIAEFMGYEFTQTPDCGILGGNKFTKLPKKSNEPPFTVYHGWCPPNYNSSWDWLMPVVEKIEIDRCKFSIEKNKCKIWAVGTFESDTTIKATWIAVIKFIEWYNGNKTINN